MKRTRLRRTTPLRSQAGLQRATRLRSKTKGRARPDEPLADRCEARATPWCLGPAHHRHHKRLRSQGGSDDKANTVDVCSRCHAWIHANPLEAALRGLLVLRRVQPVEVSRSTGVQSQREQEAR